MCKHFHTWICLLNTSGTQERPLSQRYLYWNIETRDFDLCQTINLSEVSVALLPCCFVVGWCECRGWVGIVMILLGKPGYFTGKRDTRTLGCSKPVLIYIAWFMSLSFFFTRAHSYSCLSNNANSLFASCLSVSTSVRVCQGPTICRGLNSHKHVLFLLLCVISCDSSK